MHVVFSCRSSLRIYISLVFLPISKEYMSLSNHFSDASMKCANMIFLFWIIYFLGFVLHIRLANVDFFNQLFSSCRFYWLWVEWSLSNTSMTCYRLTQPNFDHLLDLTTSIHFLPSKFDHRYKMYGGGRI